MAQVRDHREQGAEKKMSKGQRPNRTDGEKKRQEVRERERETGRTRDRLHRENKAKALRHKES